MSKTIREMDDATARAAARFWGAQGGKKNTAKQRAWRHAPKPFAGRPKGSRNKPKDGGGVRPVPCGRGCLETTSAMPGDVCGLGRTWAAHESTAAPGSTKRAPKG